VPSNCEILVGFRIPPAISVEQLRDTVQVKVNEFGENNPAVKVSLVTLDSTEPYLADKRSLLVKAFARAIWKIRGTRVKLINKTGTGDMNHYGPEMNVPVVTYGPGDPHLDHTSHERVSINDYKSSIEVLKEAIRIIHQKHHIR
jgi:LysW-gamma-L-lysine carboxypeptidase